MTLSDESKFPNRRTYVLKMRRDASPASMAGRLENLVTGQQREFASADELLHALERELEAGGSAAARDAPGA